MICVRCSLPAVAANNGNVAKSVAAQCLAGYNNSAAAKGVQFFSLYNLAPMLRVRGRIGQSFRR
jgi:hypothetical protein